MRLNDEQLQAVAELVRGHNRQFLLFLEALGDYGEKLVQRMLYEEREQVEVVRGMARAVTEILETVRDAPDQFSRVKEKT
ncbi:MAG TPA: hypothetical protein ENJ90_05365 [Devosia sp.]|nr:hypothetical protein [Devosia sp.]